MDAPEEMLRMRTGRSRGGYDYSGLEELTDDALSGGAVLGMLLGDDGSLRGLILCGPGVVFRWGETLEVASPKAYTNGNYTSVCVYRTLGLKPEQIDSDKRI